MILKEKIDRITNGFLKGTDKFIMDIDVKPGNLIIVTIDGDSLVTIEDCIKLSRSIENSLDRDAEDFELRVRSYGADNPLVLPRQYKKHIGRELNILLTDESRIQGKLHAVNEEDIVVLEKSGNTKKQKEMPEKSIPFSDISDARIVLSFK